MVFNINDWQGNCAMHCATIFEAISFTNHLHSLGKTWSGGQRYINGHHNWTHYKEESAYAFNSGQYTNISFYKDNNYTILEWKDFMYDTPVPLVDKTNRYDRNIITLCNNDFIMFPEENGIVPIVMQGYLWEERFDRHTNNLNGSHILSCMQDLLNAIEMEIGAENVIEFETDLTSLNGHKDYGKIKSKISLPTFDFYRKHIKIFDKHRDDIGEYWWLSTPFSMNRGRCCVVCDNGDILSSGYDNFNKIRPILHIKADALTVQN